MTTHTTAYIHIPPRHASYFVSRLPRAWSPVSDCTYRLHSLPVPVWYAIPVFSLPHTVP